MKKGIEKKTVLYGLRPIKCKNEKKKHSSIFGVQKELSFRGGRKLSSQIDDILYGGGSARGKKDG